MREREMSQPTRRRNRTTWGMLLVSALIIPALFIGCSRNSGSSGSKGPGFGAAITGTASNGLATASISFNPSFITPGGSTGITLLLTTTIGVPIEGENVQWSTTVGTLQKVAGKTDAAGKDTNEISIPENFAGSEVVVTAVVAGFSVQGKLLTSVPGQLRIDPPGPLFLAPGDTQFLNCVGGVDPVRWEPSGGTLNRLNERSVIFTAGSQTGTFFVKCTDAAGNSASVEINITNAPGDTLKVTPTTVTLSPGQKQTFQASGGRPDYKWSFPFGAGTLSNTTGASTTFTAGATSGTFTLILTDSAGATASATVNITVPPLTISPTAVTVERTATGGSGTDPGSCGTVAFTANFVGSGGVLGYTWNNTFTTAGAITPTSSTTATYSFSLSMGGGSKIEDSVTLTDSKGALVTAKVTVTCNPAPVPPSSLKRR